VPNNITNRLNNVLSTLNSNKLTNEAYKHFVSVTPIRSGNARRNTTIVGNSIEANYPYAERLETGYSKQAPKGMTEPTIEHIRNYVYIKTGIRI
jgi:hypothetical protein